jgi:glucokinase
MKRQPGFAIGVDVGGTKIAAGLVRFPEGELSELLEIRTLPERGGGTVLRDVEQLVERIAKEKFCGVGIGICELVDGEGNLLSANCISWNAREVQERLARFGAMRIEADVRAAALAEALFGAGAGAKTFLYVTVGTGISSCLVIDGKPFTGARGAAGTMASGPMPAVTPQIQPSLEAIASGPGLVAQFRAAGGDEPSAQGVIAAAEAANRKAMAVVRQGGRALGGTIGLLVNVLDPELVVIGGGLGLREGIYRDALVEAARRHIWWVGHREVPIVSAATGTAAGVIGAAASVWMQQRVNAD